MDNHVIPVVEQLQRRLAPDNLTSQGKGEEEEHPGVRNDYETGERNGTSSQLNDFCFCDRLILCFLLYYCQFCRIEMDLF